ncbi:MAG: fatty acid desaturase family protein [Nevskiales bacterium]
MATTTLSPAELEAFGKEMDAIRAEAMAQVGQEDADYIRNIIRAQRYLALSGRGLLWFGFFPLTWVPGTIALGFAKILENMEIGHNVMHGQYDWMGDDKLHSQTYEWDTVCDGDQWRHSHNYMHHTFTNVLGKDRDVGYGILRMDERQPWERRFLLQPLWNFLLASNFDIGVGVHDAEFDRYWAGEIDRKELARRLKPFAKKASRLWLKDYVVFPLLSGPNFLGTAAGNLVANLIRNFWTYSIIFCGHFPDGVEVFEYTEDELKNETKGQWYLRQLRGSANIEGGKLFHIMSGNLSHQIEHHLFPDVPAHRYADMSVKVREVCERYGLDYNTGGFWKQFLSVQKKVFKLALPGRKGGGNSRPAKQDALPLADAA